MNVSGSDLKHVVGFGLGGAIIASAYSVFQIYAVQQLGKKLEIETCALQDDDQLFGYLQTLQNDFKNKDNIAFGRIVNAADQLVFLRMQLHNKIILPGFEDRVESYVLFKRLQDGLENLVNDFMSHSEAKEIVKLQKLSSNIAERAELQITAIMRMCQHL